METLTFANKLRLKSGSRHHAERLGIDADDVFAIEDWRSGPGFPVTGLIRLRDSSGNVSAYLEPDHFEAIC